jgi:hypothetical protein
VRKLLSVAVCLALSACAGSSREREEGTTAARAREREDEDMERAMGGSRAASAATDEDPLVQVSRKLEEEKSGVAEQPASIEQHDAHAEQANKKVGVKGIHGTLSPFDVKVTLDKQAKAFGKCHEPRARKVPALAGGLEFNIRVLASGEVADVNVRQSDVGDRVLERCFSEVIRNTRFPAPHGGEATVQYTMALAPGRKHRAPEEWDSERIEKVLKKNRSELLETCEVKRPGSIVVTAYVSKRGKVLAAGVAAPDDKSADKFDCIADELRTWSMPKPRKGVAKVSFPLRG